MSHRELLSQVENRLALVITVAIFFAALAYTFFKFVGESEVSASGASLSVSIQIVLSLISYVVFTLTKNKLSIKQLKWIDGMLILSIASCIIPAAFMAEKKAKLVGIEVISFTGSLWVMVAAYALTFAMVMLMPAWNWMIKQMRS